MYFDMLTGELSEHPPANPLELSPDWFPYHNLEGRYVGFKKTHQVFDGKAFAKIVDGIPVDVETYEKMDW